MNEDDESKWLFKIYTHIREHSYDWWWVNQFITLTDYGSVNNLKWMVDLRTWHMLKRARGEETYCSMKAYIISTIRRCCEIVWYEYMHNRLIRDSFDHFLLLGKFYSVEIMLDCAFYYVYAKTPYKRCGGWGNGVKVNITELWLYYIIDILELKKLEPKQICFYDEIIFSYYLWFTLVQEGLVIPSMRCIFIELILQLVDDDGEFS